MSECQGRPYRCGSPHHRIGGEIISPHRVQRSFSPRINAAFAQRGLNIAAQQYQTQAELGYIVVDSEGARAEAQSILAELRDLPGTLRARLIHERG